MSWLKRLLFDSERISPPPAPVAGQRITLGTDGKEILSIPELDFVGQRADSPDRRHTLLWHDRMSYDGNAADGRYVLVSGGAVVVDCAMERPHDGKVADDGTFILNDWGASTELVGTFHAFRADGTAILSRQYSANLLNNGLSRNGRLAVCQTCNAPGSPDGSVLTIFDLAAGAELARWTPESGWANGYEFPEGARRIRMLRRERPPLEYSLEGEFLDRKLWLKDEVARGTLYVIRRVLAEGEAATGISAEALREGTRKLIAEDERFEAQGWRLLGEI